MTSSEFVEVRVGMTETELELPPPDLPAQIDTQPQARLLDRDDLPALMDLEREKWTVAQAAHEDELRRRIDAHPDLALGAFCPCTPA